MTSECHLTPFSDVNLKFLRKAINETINFVYGNRVLSPPFVNLVAHSFLISCNHSLVITCDLIRIPKQLWDTTREATQMVPMAVVKTIMYASLLRGQQPCSWVCTFLFLSTCLLVSFLLACFVKLTQSKLSSHRRKVNLSWESAPNWPVGRLWSMFLIGDWGGRVKPIVGSASLGV